MADLAACLFKKGIEPKDPFKENETLKARAQGLPDPVFSDSDSEKSQDSERRVSFASSNTNATNSTDDGEEETDEEDTMASPPTSILKKKVGRPKSTGLSEGMSRMNLSDGPQPVKGILPCPCLTGRWEQFDHALGVMKGHCMLRILFHAGLTANDFRVTWIDQRTLKIKVKWPTLMQSSLLMAGLDQTVTPGVGGGTVNNHPEGHKVCDGMGAVTAALKDKDGFIWSEGIFSFKNPVESTHQDKIFNPVIDASNNDGTVLQVVLNECFETSGDGFTSPTAAGKGTLRLGEPVGNSSSSSHADGRNKRPWESVDSGSDSGSDATA